MRAVIIKSSILFCIVALVGSMLYCISPIYQPYPEPMGPYAVGTITTTLVDQQKPEIGLTWYYPSNIAKSKTQYSSQPLARQAYKIEKQRTSWVPQFAWNYLLSTIKSYAAPGVPTQSNKKYPIIIFAPDNNPYTTYITYLEEIASHGYIIVAVTNTNDNLTQVLDALPIYNTDPTFILHNNLQLDRIGALGNGSGAKSIQDLCSIDPRCKASISMSWFSPTMTQSKKPLMAFLGKEWANAKDVPHRDLQELDDPFLPFITTDFGANAFSDYVLLQWPWSKFYDVGPHWARNAIADSIRIFFDWYLKNDLQIKQPAPQSGATIVLNGTSSAGKSDLANELQMLYGNKCRIIKLDDFEAFYVIKNPIIAFTGPKIYFTPERQEKRWHDFYTYAKQLASSGYHVFIDTVRYDEDYEKYSDWIGNNLVYKVLVYCPLDTIIERVAQRSKNKLERRTVAQAIEQFCEIYRLQESATEPIVDHVQTNRMQTALDVATKEMSEMKRVSSEYIATFDKDFTEQFKLKTLKEITLTTKHPWDLIVNSGNHSAHDLALIVYDYLKTKGLSN